ncbi:aminoglycoside N(3)-acetyltransferase [Paenibacillus sp. MMS18-CY102]|uniref:aminoglycoside N(3)-acetyltransferase n=1 Tax=Paenibacillus sp. MMS18-CY102 TaxID=2682849 RepID=UPI0013666522|nr:AAC(3) family N-acetyltransferase [Paenibacillus sp. MMS18-CY102]MWC27648.1 aminoglycoside N(3)-acetyltransferase [Paenibacillus sp. MMS18-CY102]
MSEKDIIDQTESPVTINKMVQDLNLLGVREGDTILVHSSISKLGWVCGGPQAAVEGLLQAIGESGTLVMPAHSSDWSDPAEWGNPPVPHAWIDIIYNEWPPFDPAVTPTREMGRIAEAFRTYPGTMRSEHPQTSFCAKGQQAGNIVRNHPLTPQLGVHSPLGKLYDLNAKVLLLGVGYDKCTSFHLAETVLTGMPMKQMGTAMLEGGSRVWKWFTDFAYDAEDFITLGEHFEQKANVQRGNVGNAECRLFEIKEAVDFASQWLQEHRDYA